MRWWQLKDTKKILTKSPRALLTRQEAPYLWKIQAVFFPSHENVTIFGCSLNETNNFLIWQVCSSLSRSCENLQLFKLVIINLWWLVLLCIGYRNAFTPVWLTSTLSWNQLMEKYADLWLNSRSQNCCFSLRKSFEHLICHLFQSPMIFQLFLHNSLKCRQESL